MKESLVGHASDVCGKRFVGCCMRKGSEWWNEGVKMKVEEKERVFEAGLQSLSRRESEVFGWSRNLKSTRSRSRSQNF